jgi:hypothetical protein
VSNTYYISHEFKVGSLLAAVMVLGESTYHFHGDFPSCFILAPCLVKTVIVIVIVIVIVRGVRLRLRGSKPRTEDIIESLKLFLRGLPLASKIGFSALGPHFAEL